MNDTSEDTAAGPNPGPGASTDSGESSARPSLDHDRLRGIADTQRPTDDRIVAGVCAGIARHLGIDPVIVRVVIVALSVVGLAGLILYLAGWLFLPSVDAEKSIAADWFKLDKNEPEARAFGLVAATALAVLSIIGDSGWGWGWGNVSWVAIPLAVLVWLFVIRPRNRRATEHAARLADQPPAPAASTATSDDDTVVQPVTATRVPRDRRSKALTWLTLSLIAIAVAAVRIYAEYHDGVLWTTYVAVALGVVAAGLLVGTFFGHGGPLIAIGVLLAVLLAIAALLPSPRIGTENKPVSSSSVEPSYKLGIGDLDVDLTRLDDSVALEGRTISIDVGIGSTQVIVPKDVNVEVHSTLRAGEIRVFDRKVNGTDNDLDYDADDPSAPKLTLDLEQSLGDLEVVRR